MNSEVFSHSAIDQLGERLRAEITESDIRLLDQYRRTFREDYDRVVAALRTRTGIEVSGRPAKSTASIVDKLNRGSMRLSQMQDIAGCRTVAADIAVQDQIVAEFAQLFPTSIFDRRERPSHGYRAVHVIARPNLLPIEIQVRTQIQHLWAEISEKFADKYGAEVKYGGGPEFVRRSLDAMSYLAQRLERLESSTSTKGTAARKQEIEELKRDIQRDFAGILNSVKERL